MSVSRIATRYAKSLLSLAQDQQKLDRVLEDVKSFIKATESKDFFLLLKSPIIHASKKKEIFSLLFNERFDKTTMAFLNIIANKGRESFLTEIMQGFITQYKKMMNITTVKLITASPLSDETLASIHSKLASSTDSNVTIELDTSVDKNIIGGFVIDYDNKMYNASVAYKLERLKKEFSKNTYLKGF